MSSPAMTPRTVRPSGSRIVQISPTRGLSEGIVAMVREVVCFCFSADERYLTVANLVAYGEFRIGDPTFAFDEDLGGVFLKP